MNDQMIETYMNLHTNVFGNQAMASIEFDGAEPIFLSSN